MKLIAARKLHFIVNPVSGRSGSFRVAEGLRRRLEGSGCQVVFRRTDSAGHSRRLAMEACEQGAEVLVIVGGDGTICEAADGLLAAHDSGASVVSGADASREIPPILIVPTGTENLLGRYLGIRLNLETLWGLLCDQRIVTLDAGMVNGRTFLMVAGMGFDAEVVRRLSVVRRGHICYASYFEPLWRTFWSYRQPQVSVEADGTLLFEGRGMVFVGNIPRYAIGLRLLDRATPLDGLLDVCVMECAWQGPLLRHAVNVLLRRHIGARGVHYQQAQKVRVWSAERSVGLELDGDYSGELPAKFGVRPSAVRFLVPPGWEA